MSTVLSGYRMEVPKPKGNPRVSFFPLLLLRLEDHLAMFA